MGDKEKGKMEGCGASSSLLNLLCSEDKSCLNENEEGQKMGDQFPHLQQQIPCFDLQNEDDYVKLLVQKENQTQFGSKHRPSWLRDARLDAVNWILNAQTLLGFRNQTAYLSITYFDRFLATRHIEEDKLWAIRLLSIACLTVAGKMEECKVPAFSELPLTKEHNSMFDFDCRVIIQKMELLVLNTLGWKMSLITPFVYIHYLVKKLGDQGAKLDELITRAFELLMAIVKEINLTDHRPSLIAAAAVLAAIDWQLTREALKLKISTVLLWETLENQEEELFTCYSLMQRLATMGNLSTPRLTEVDQTVCSTSATTSIVGAKRKLSFRDSDQKS